MPFLKFGTVDNVLFSWLMWVLSCEISQYVNTLNARKNVYTFINMDWFMLDVVLPLKSFQSLRQYSYSDDLSFVGSCILFALVLWLLYYDDFIFLKRKKRNRK